MRRSLGCLGQYTDPETGLIYLRARYYDPTTAQFLTRDPAVTETRSAYGYTLDNPLNRTDPTGLCASGETNAKDICVNTGFYEYVQSALSKNNGGGRNIFLMDFKGLLADEFSTVYENNGPALQGVLNNLNGLNGEANNGCGESSPELLFICEVSHVQPGSDTLDLRSLFRSIDSNIEYLYSIVIDWTLSDAEHAELFGDGVEWFSPIADLLVQRGPLPC